MSELPVSKILLCNRVNPADCASDCAPDGLNRIEKIGGGVARVWLTRGLFCLIEEGDIGLIIDRRWHASDRPYARSNRGGKTTFMHRLICGADDGQVVDHLNWNTLDNRRINLRACTQAENQQNRDPRKLGGVKKMTGAARRKPWRATWIGRHLGTFTTEAEAWARIEAERVAVLANNPRP